MRASLIIVGLLLLLLCGAGFIYLSPRFTTLYRFDHQNDDYYATLSQACDLVLAEHPLGTNKFIELSVNDPSLPQIIRDLQPQKIKIGPQSFWMVHRDSFGITWGKSDYYTNFWVLSSCCESDERDLYRR